MSFLSRLKSITRYSRRWPPPRHHDVTSPRLLRPPDRCRFSVSGRYGSLVVISSKVSDVLPRTPGEVGLYLRIGMMSYAPCRKSGSFSPSRSFTYAFFQSERRPTYLPWRLNFPCASDVRTLWTFEPRSCSTAFLMSILLASIATWNTSVRPSSRMTVVFSVMRGRLSTVVSFIVLPQRLLQLLDGRACQHDPARVHHVARE